MPENLEDLVLVQVKDDAALPTFSNVIEQDALDRFDSKKNKRKPGRKSGRRRPQRPQKSAQNGMEN
jgi:stage III sporulation protein SpoIIIAA